MVCREEMVHMRPGHEGVGEGDAGLYAMGSMQLEIYWVLCHPLLSLPPHPNPVTEGWHTLRYGRSL